jgi:hypothetical protein
LKLRGVAVDRAGSVYIADSWNYRARKVDQKGITTTLAGAGPYYPGDGGPATQASLTNPYACVARAGRLYIADSGAHRVRRVDQDGEITTIAGTGVAGFSGDGGPAIDTQLNESRDVAVDPDPSGRRGGHHHHGCGPGCQWLTGSGWQSPAHPVQVSAASSFSVFPGSSPIGWFPAGRAVGYRRPVA